MSDFTWRRLFKLVAGRRDDMPPQSSDGFDSIFPNVGFDRFQLQPFPVHKLIDQDSTAQGRDIV